MNKLGRWYRKNRFVIKMGLFAVGAGSLYILSKAVAAKLDEKGDKYSDLTRSGTQSMYSFCGSQLHLMLDDAIVEGYNRFVDAFLDAQIQHEKRHGHKWQYDEDLLIKTRKSDRLAYHAVGDVINHMIAVNGGSLHIREEDCTSEHLEKLEQEFLRDLNAAETE